MKPATLVAAALCVASVAAFAPKASGAALMQARSSRVAPSVTVSFERAGRRGRDDAVVKSS